MEDFNPQNTLYKEILFEHYRSPKNKGVDQNKKVWSIKNPTCGDEVGIQFEIEDGKIKKVLQNTVGCIISTSSSSIMSELLKGKSLDEAIYFAENFIKMLKGQEYDKSCDFGDGVVFETICDYPARYKCASTAWEIALTALKNYKNE